ncbi:cystatin-C-like [Diadema antillarum]|uniref:cystatin-C-like n=1 Tax=Diadema antillarum TaxID=105358 RepID=UPI003A8C2AA9
MQTLSVLILVMAAAVAMAAAGATNEKEKRVGGIKPVPDARNVPEKVIEVAMDKFDSVRDDLEKENKEMSEYWLSDAAVGQINYQIVSGVLYYVTVLVGESSCSYNAPIDLSECSLSPSPGARAVFECKVRVWFQPWVPFLEAVDLDKDCQHSEMRIPS